MPKILSHQRVTAEVPRADKWALMLEGEQRGRGLGDILVQLAEPGLKRLRRKWAKHLEMIAAAGSSE